MVNLKFIYAQLLLVYFISLDEIMLFVLENLFEKEGKKSINHLGIFCVTILLLHFKNKQIFYSIETLLYSFWRLY